MKCMCYIQACVPTFAEAFYVCGECLDMQLYSHLLHAVHANVSMHAS